MADVNINVNKSGFVAPPPSYHAPPAAFNVGATAPVVVMAPLSLTEHPQRLTCTYCHADVVTETKYVDGRMTHIWAIVLCFLGCWCCCCIPYCTESLKDVEHECPNCHRHIGTYKR